MAFRDETTKYGKADLSAQDTEFSLEDILAEYGSSREQKLMEAVERAAEQTPGATAPEPERPKEQTPPPEEQPPDSKPPVPETPEKPADRKNETPQPEPQPELPPAPRPISLEEVEQSHEAGFQCFRKFCAWVTNGTATSQGQGSCVFPWGLDSQIL